MSMEMLHRYFDYGFWILNTSNEWGLNFLIGKGGDLHMLSWGHYPVDDQNEKVSPSGLLAGDENALMPQFPYGSLLVKLEHNSDDEGAPIINPFTLYWPGPDDGSSPGKYPVRSSHISGAEYMQFCINSKLEVPSGAYGVAWLAIFDKPGNFLNRD